MKMNSLLTRLIHLQVRIRLAKVLDHNLEFRHISLL